jgi:hypothetical protein
MGFYHKGSSTLVVWELVALLGSCGFDSFNLRVYLAIYSLGRWGQAISLLWWGQVVRFVCAGTTMAGRWGQATGHDVWSQIIIIF